MRNKIVCLLTVQLLLWAGFIFRSVGAEGFREPLDVSFIANCDGSEEHYVLLLPEDFAEENPYSLMIALHGHGSDRWQFATGDINEGRAARDVALKRDMIYVSPDYRAKTSWMGPKAEADVMQIIEALKATYVIEKVILVGASMGGSSSLTFAAMHPDLIDGVAALNGTANHLEYEKFQDAIRESFGGSRRDIPEAYKLRSAEYWPERFTMPVAMTTGGKDTVVPPDSCLRLGKIIALFNSEVLHLHRPDGGHSTTYEDAVAAYEFVCEKATDH